MTEINELILPYGGKLIDLVPDDDQAHELKNYGNTLPSIQVSDRVMYDLELLATGAFSPLDRFMCSDNLGSVLESMRLTDGHIFPIPLTLPIAADSPLKLDQDIAMRDAHNNLLAVMTVEEIYPWDREEFSRGAFGTTDLRHPLVAELHRWGELNISGKLRVIQLPIHYDFRSLRLTPAETREQLEAIGRKNVVAFQTRNPLHRVHEELTKRAIEDVDGVLLLHPVVGMTKPGDVDHYT